MAKASSFEYPARSGITIRTIINRTTLPGGVRADFGQSYLVDIPQSLATKRIRRQFDTKDGAKGYAEKEFGRIVREGQRAFAITPEQREDAVRAFGLLKAAGLKHSLSDAIAVAIRHMSPEGGNKSFAEAAEELIASKTARFKRGGYRLASYEDFKTRAKALMSGLGQIPIQEVSKDEVLRFIKARCANASGRTMRNYRMVAGEILKYAQQRRYLSVHPFSYLTDEEVKELEGSSGEARAPAILSPANAADLLRVATDSQEEIGLLPFVTLALFCGLRTEELKRLDWSAIKDDTARPFVSLSAEITKKRRIRNVPIPMNALEWLALVPFRVGPVMGPAKVKTYEKRFFKLLTYAGYRTETPDGRSKSNWDTNCMRHSFGSYRYALTGDSIATSRELGHKQSDDVLFQHYRALTTREEAVRYFTLAPSASPSDLVEQAFPKVNRDFLLAEWFGRNIPGKESVAETRQA